MDKNVFFQAEKISKSYGASMALRNIDMEIYPGEIVGLIGENGAGKSTLLKIITGVEQPTMGTIKINGENFQSANSIQANEAGIGMVFQEQSLINNLTVAQNIFLGREHQYRKMGIVNWKQINAEALKALQAIGVNDIEPNKKCWDLNFAPRQMVEIAKVFNTVTTSNAPRAMILLDEPTSVLGDAEVQQLFTQMRRLKEEGNTIIFVSHRLNEVLEITDRIYIFKDGENAGLVETKDATESILYEKMVGRSTTDEYFKTQRQTIPDENVVLAVKGLSKLGTYRDVNFTLHKGEVLGICGVEGSGKEEVCAAICGDESPTSGEIVLEGKQQAFNSPTQALKQGILSIPKERREEGMIGMLSISENIILSNLKGVSRFGIVSKKKQTNTAKQWVEKLGVKCSSIHNRMTQLSGGNAQKVVFARAMFSNLKVVILNHPTRGVDVGSKEEIYNLIRDITDKGVSVILLGDTLDECIGLSSKILVMKDGLISGTFDSPASEKPSQVDIVQYMM